MARDYVKEVNSLLDEAVALTSENPADAVEKVMKAHKLLIGASGVVRADCSWMRASSVYRERISDIDHILLEKRFDLLQSDSDLYRL